MTSNFKDGSFKSPNGDVVDAKVMNGVLAMKFMDTNDFIEYAACENGWWWAGYSDYSAHVDGNDILLSKGITIGGNPILYQRIS